MLSLRRADLSPFVNLILAQLGAQELGASTVSFFVFFCVFFFLVFFFFIRLMLLTVFSFYF